MSHGGEGADYLVQASEVMRKVNTASKLAILIDILT